jgi:hypothetical protein
MSRIAVAHVVLASSALMVGCASHRNAAAPTATSVSDRAAAQAPAGLEIVRVVGRHQTIVVTSGPNGPLYSVNDDEGRQLVAAATLDELRATQPGLYRLLEQGLAVDAHVEAKEADGWPIEPPGGGALMLDSAR